MGIGFIIILLTALIVHQEPSTDSERRKCNGGHSLELVGIDKWGPQNNGKQIHSFLRVHYDSDLKTD